MSRRVVLVALALLLGTAGILFAHATLVRSEPLAGAVLGTSPGRVYLVFSEPLESTLARVSILSVAGRSTELVASGDPHDVHAIIAPMNTLASGAYRVVWRVVSADGHPVEGSYTFAIGAQAGNAPAAPPPPVAESTAGEELPLVAAVMRGMGLFALMALAGLLFFEPPNAPSGTARVLAFAAPTFLVAHALMWARNVMPMHELSADGLTQAMGSGVGQVEAWRTGLIVLALWALALARRARLALVFAALALLASGASGHSAAIHPLWAVPAKAMHLVAGAAWIGGVTWLLVIERTDVGRFMREARRVSSVAMMGVILVAASGVLQALLFLPTPSAVLGSTYGNLVLAKAFGLLVLVALGAHHRSKMVRGGRHPSRFMFTLRGEVFVMLVVTILGAVLAHVPPTPR